MKRPPPRFTRTDTLFPYTTLFRSVPAQVRALVQGKDHLGSTTVPLPRIAFQFEWSMCLQPARRRGRPEGRGHPDLRSEEHTSGLQSLMRKSYAVFCLKTTNNTTTPKTNS